MAPASTPGAPFGRLLTAMVTPMRADGALDLDGVQKLASHLVDLGNDAARLDRLVAQLPDRYGTAGFGLNLPNFALAPIRGSGLGFYSFLYRYMYGTDASPPAEAITPEIGRCENLRADLLAFFERANSAVVGMEACPGSQWLARKLSAMGHQVRIVAAQFVKPYVKSQKNDTIDAEAIGSSRST